MTTEKRKEIQTMIEKYNSVDEYVVNSGTYGETIRVFFKNTDQSKKENVIFFDHDTPLKGVDAQLKHKHFKLTGKSL